MNRAADVAIAGGTLLLASPVIALAALAVKLEDGGPVLYRQTRVGRNGADERWVARTGGFADVGTPDRFAGR